MFFLDMLINVDHGALPAASVALKNDLNMGNVELGSLGSLVFLGLVIGSGSATLILNFCSFKWLLAISFLGNGIGLVVFTATKNFVILCFSRFLSGFFQIFLTIYIPLYVDTYATSTTKPCMLSLILLAPPLGVVFGYGLTAVLIDMKVSWRISFILQGVTMACSCLVTLLIPDKYINIDDVLKLKKEAKDRATLMLEHELKLANEFLEADINLKMMGEKGGTGEF